MEKKLGALMLLSIIIIIIYVLLPFYILASYKQSFDDAYFPLLLLLYGFRVYLVVGYSSPPKKKGQTIRACKIIFTSPKLIPSFFFFGGWVQ